MSLQQFAEKALTEFSVNPSRLIPVGGDHFMTYRQYKRNYGWMEEESRYLEEKKARLGTSIIYTGD